MSFTTLEVYPTSRCTLCCTGCQLCFGNKEWTEEQTREILMSGIFEQVTGSITVLGGEPTLWDNLRDFLDAVRFLNNKVEIEVVTNGIKYDKNFIGFCQDNHIKIAVSWKENRMSLNAVEAYKKAEILSKVIFIPVGNLDELKREYDILSKVVKCVWRPFIGGQNINTLVHKANKFLFDIPVKNIESSVRVIDKKQSSNLELIKNAADDPKFMKKFQCRNTDNAIIYTDGKFYHCLSQAMAGYHPFETFEKPEHEWTKCKYSICCCDTFPIRTAK